MLIICYFNKEIYINWCFVDVMKIHPTQPSLFCFKLEASLLIPKVKVKSSMARSLPVENLLPQNVGSIINYLQ